MEIFCVEIVSQQNGQRKAVNVTGPNGAFVKSNQPMQNMNKRNMSSLLHSNPQRNQRSNDRSIAKQNALEYLWNNKHLSMMSERGRCVWNFGYGANINPWKLENKRGIHPIGNTLRGKMIGWRLLFDHKGGFGNVIHVNTEANGLRIHKFKPFMNGKEYEVHGVLLKLTHADFIKLAQMESKYELLEVKVQIYDDDDGVECVNAIVFKSPEGQRAQCADILPTKRYIDLIQRGAQKMNLDAKYCEWLNGIPGIDSKKRGKEYY